MSDIFDSIWPLAVIALIAFLFYGLMQVIFADMDADNVQYEQCIAADKQWVEESLRADHQTRATQIFCEPHNQSACGHL